MLPMGLHEQQGLHERYGLTRLINARGPFTPAGVSRSDGRVGRAVAEALAGFVVMEELSELADRTLARVTGAEAGTVVHCTSSAITLAVAAAMTGESVERIAALPDTGGLPARVVLPAGHAVDYGHPLVQDIRLAGATPVLSGSDSACTVEELEKDLAHPGTACLVLVSSRLTRGARVPLTEAVAAAHRRGVPAVVDGAAQDFRVGELLAAGADLVLVSGQKYLGGPTAGLVVGRAEAVRAVRAQGKGIGRAMKASKESIVGTLAALEARQELDVSAWARRQEEKVARFCARAAALPGLTAHPVPDPTGLPFPRAVLRVDAARAGSDASALAVALRSGDPQIWLYTDRQDDGELALELVPLTDEEIDVILNRVTEVLAEGSGVTR